MEEDCCLLLDDLALDGDALRLEPAADASPSPDAVHVLDLDGDGTDELLATRSLPPLGDISYPVQRSRLPLGRHRLPATRADELTAGSGDTPFILGDSDGRPGDEAAIISTLGRPALYRIMLGPGDTLSLEDAGVVATDAVAVPIGAGRGIALLGPGPGLVVHAWPAGEPLGPPLAQEPMVSASFLDVITIDEVPRPWCARRHLERSTSSACRISRRARRPASRAARRRPRSRPARSILTSGRCRGVEWTASRR